MTVIETLILSFTGFVSGALIAAGLFAFITMVGVVSRMAGRTHTSKRVTLYEDMVILGGSIGNAAYLFAWQLPIGTIGLGIFGMFSGIFVGCLAIALAEIAKTFPVLGRKIKLLYGVPFVVIALALGKGIGSILQLLFLK